MNTTMKRLSAACASALLLACANAPPDRSVPEVAGESATARNRYATELAEKGDYAGAIATWRALTATHTGPEAAYLHRNLGYALFLNGEYGEALVALERACVLDPLNPRGWQHLGSALRKLGKHERAEMMFRQGATLERNEFTVDYALASGSDAPATVNAVAAQPRPSDNWGARELDASGGVIDLRGITAQPHLVEAQPQPVVVVLPAAEPLPVATPALVAEYAGATQGQVVTAPVDMPTTVTTAFTSEASEARQPVRVEVSNGNGVRGMAAETARRIASKSVRVVRLTNAQGFNVARTRVEYVNGYQEAASKLAQRFGAATMVEIDNCWKADMRLVIGKDQARGASVVAAALAAKGPRAAAGADESGPAEKLARTAAPPARG